MDYVRFTLRSSGLAVDDWGDMPTKKPKRGIGKSSSTQKGVEKVLLSSLRGEVSRTEKALAKAKSRAARWRREAEAQKRSASRARARVESCVRSWTGHQRHGDRPEAAAPTEVMASGRQVAAPATTDTVMAPDETWSVVQLRAEARARGLTGMSNKTKAQLLAALS